MVYERAEEDKEAIAAAMLKDNGAFVGSKNKKEAAITQPSSIKAISEDHPVQHIQAGQ